MIRFKNFISESIRVGLPHLYSTKTEKGNDTPSLTPEQFKQTTAGGKIHVHDVTEKTDGQTFKFGHDEHGFYSQHSGSGNEQIRTGAGHVERAKRRAKETGKDFNPAPYEAFSKFHDALHKNEKLQSYLKTQHEKTGSPVEVRGEAFNRNIATPSHVPGEVKFVHTSYSTKGMGKHGSFVIHSKLPENQHHNLDHLMKMSDSNITFQHDKVDVPKAHVDVSNEVGHFNKLDHDLMAARTTPSNKQSKLSELEKFNRIKKSVHDKVQNHLDKLGISNKFGSGTEGLIVHPSAANSEAARFKVVNPSFKEAKSASRSFK